MLSNALQETSWTAPLEVKALLDKKPKVKSMHQYCKFWVIGVFTRERKCWKLTSSFNVIP